MKKLMSLFAAILFAGAVFACNVPNGYTERQTVRVYTNWGSSSSSCTVYQATNACDAYGICFAGCWYYVSKSNKEGYGYMFWCNGDPYYFNM